MTYNEWRDELKQNLLCVTEAERNRVLDYYAEAYADRREAGFSEREIIEDFGAPYDAAQRILGDNKGEVYEEFPADNGMTRREKRRENREARRAAEEFASAPPPPPPPVYTPPATAKIRNDYTWVFVLLCIVFAIPIFAVVMAMVGITIGFCVAPVAVAGAGAAGVVWSFVTMGGGDIAFGIFQMGAGFVIAGLGIILCPFFFKLVGWMWKLFNMFFKWLRSLFSGKEVTV